MINSARTTNKDDQRKIANFVDLLALFASHQFKGCTPWNKNVATAERFTQITLTKSSNNAPIAGVIWPEPISIPNVTVGGSNATATITPIIALGSPIVNERAPALPDASARTMSPNPTLVLDSSSGIVGSI